MSFLCELIAKREVHNRTRLTVKQANAMLEQTCSSSGKSYWLIDYLLRECKSTWLEWCACVAAREGNLDTFSYLVKEHGASVLQGVFGCCMSERSQSVESLDAIVQEFQLSDWDLQSISVDDGLSLLHVAVTSQNPEMIQHLVDRYNFDVYELDASKNTPLELLLEIKEYADEAEEDDDDDEERFQRCREVLELIQNRAS